eukprot:6492321-Amphidinium_carterae.1
MAARGLAAAAADDDDDDDNDRDGAGRFANARLPPLINNKVIPHPQKLTEKTHWFNWRFEFENYLVCLSEEYLEEMRLALLVGGVVMLPQEAAIRRRAFALYRLLASLCTGKALDLVKSCQSTRNGYEAWRLIVLEYEPTNTTRKLAVLSDVLKAPGLDCKKSPETFAIELLRWEEQVRRYEEFPSSAGGGPARLDEDIKKAILLDRMPEELATHIRVLVSDRTTYAELRDRIESFLSTKRMWSLGDSTGGVHMVDDHKGKGKGKGKSKDGKGGKDKDKGGGKPGACACCGAPGHHKADCYWREQQCNYCGKAGHLSRVCRSKAKAKAEGKGKAGAKPAAKAKPMQVGNVDQEPAVSETLTASVYELPDEDWIMMVEENTEESGIDVISATSKLMMDSGAVTSVSRPTSFTWSPIRQSCAKQLHGVSGDRLTQHGMRDIHGVTNSGRKIAVATTVADVSKDIMSVPELVDAGFCVVFHSNGAYISEVEPVLPSDAYTESLDRVGKLWYLPIREQCNMIVPVQEGGSSGSGGQMTEEVSEEILRMTPNEMSESMAMGRADTPVLEPVENEADFDARFLFAIRRERKAYTFRAVRKQDPYTKSQVVRRTTWCAKSGALLEDLFLADSPTDMSWNKRIPEAPRAIVTKFWHQERSKGPVEIVSREVAPEQPVALPVPGEVSDEQRESHM